MINDLREFINKVEEWGDVRIIEGVDWDVELGALTQLMAKQTDPPLLIFDKIKDYPAGYRVATNLYNTQRRVALGLDLPLEVRGVELVRALRAKEEAGCTPIPPVEVETALIKENIVTNDIDLFSFPIPKWHELDGGRFIGTGDMVIMRDPDDGWINLAAYRVQVHDRNVATVNITPGHHGDIIQRKYWKQGKSCPAAVVCGQEPILWAASCLSIPWGMSEYDYAGGLKRQPIEVCRGVTTDLLLPATAELVLEGEILPFETESIKEGPFGDWAGYYIMHERRVAVFNVHSVLYRNNPIIQGSPPSQFTSVWTIGNHIQQAAKLWQELDRQMPGIKGVWMVDEATQHGIVVISLEQQYGGHAKQAALVEAACLTTAYAVKYIIVVDEDVDPSDMSDVLWALSVRNDPGDAINIIKGCWDSRGNPSIHPNIFAQGGPFEHSTAIILACKPYSWIKQFPPSIKISSELEKKLREKWWHLFEKT